MSMKEFETILRNGYKKYLLDSGYTYSGKPAGFHIFGSKYREGCYLKIATMPMVKNCIDVQFKTPGLNYVGFPEVENGIEAYMPTGSSWYKFADITDLVSVVEHIRSVQEAWFNTFFHGLGFQEYAEIIITRKQDMVSKHSLMSESEKNELYNALRSIGDEALTRKFAIGVWGDEVLKRIKSRAP